ncbi:site-specific integrase [uncultured Cloacibacillus sp.]|uniref:site-specific integrase n=1 Tax=uncultured Cloacibacillus sp. TaxID=889794 RepID=UPI0026DCCE15|nr:site-specific integrase [uncultured Cloacibacillus sp.]
MAVIRRKDSNGRVLQSGESQRKDGIYQYRYTYGGKRETVYAPNLNELRQKEKEIQALLGAGINYAAGTIDTIELVAKYINLRQGVRYSTRVGYQFVSNILKRETFCRKPIRDILASEAKVWMKKLFDEDGYGYSTLCAIKGIIAPAFRMAYEEDVIKKNPFDFDLSGVVPNNAKPRQALTDQELIDWLDFVKNDSTYRKYYDEFIVLLGTGLRVSEFCGLTLQDIDFDEMRIKVERQLARTRSGKFYVEKPKTKNGVRYIPMSPEVCESMQNIVQQRYSGGPEIIIDGVVGFLLLDRSHRPKVALHIENELRWCMKKYQKRYPNKKLPRITPHVLRHTFCTNMARNGMAIKNLQYLMGHSDVGTTLNIYTHSRYEDAAKEMLNIRVIDTDTKQNERRTG